ncbi:MAG: stage II sporulation protein M [Deltaproteobacteria bacterium]|nr:stage II sporulation protein M [Deltaproteobacteria bacterium]
MRTKIKEELKKSLQAAWTLRNLIVFFFLAHTVFLAFGQWSVYKGFPGVLALKEELIKEIQGLPYLKPLTGVLADSLALRVLYTFAFNLIFGAFLTTTLTGVLFFLPYVIAVWRAFTIGILVSEMDLNSKTMVVFYGTYILEFGAYTLSSAVGMDIGLSLLWPGRKSRTSRKDAVSDAILNGKRLYHIVLILLFVSAVWEISWLQYLGPLLKPGSINVK